MSILRSFLVQIFLFFQEGVVFMDAIELTKKSDGLKEVACAGAAAAGAVGVAYVSNQANRDRVALDAQKFAAQQKAEAKAAAQAASDRQLKAKTQQQQQQARNLDAGIAAQKAELARLHAQAKAKATAKK